MPTGLTARNSVILLLLLLSIANATAYGAPAKVWCGSPLRAYDASVKANSTVAISGKVIEQLEWGSPGFGENPKKDTRWTAWFLELDYAAPVIPVPFHGEQSQQKIIKIRKVQLRGLLEQQDGYTEFLNRHVLAEGSLWMPSAPSDVGDVILETSQIRIIGSVACDGSILPPKI